jgi:hypothetical protein
MKLSLALFSFAALIETVSFAQVNAPRAGLARFEDQRLRIVLGIPSSLIVDRVPLGAATAASFSDYGGLIAENGNVELVSSGGTLIAVYQAADPAPVLNVDGPLATALAYLPSTQTLLTSDGTSFSHINLLGVSLQGQVSSIHRGIGETAHLLVSHADNTVSEVIVSLRTGNVSSEDYLPAAHGRALLQHGWMVSTTTYGLTVDGSTHREFRLSEKALPQGDITIERMSSYWLHVFSASTGQHWALYLSASEMSLSWLPPAGVSQ